MKSYLVLPWSSSEAGALLKKYGACGDSAEANLAAYMATGYSSVDCLYVFRKAARGDRMPTLTSPILATSDGIFAFDPVAAAFVRIEEGSEVFLLRTMHFDRECLSFIQEYARGAFKITFRFSLDFSNDLIGTKRFGLLWAHRAGLPGRFPRSVVPLFTDKSDVKRFAEFCRGFFPATAGRVVLKMDQSTGGDGVTVYDLSTPDGAHDFSAYAALAMASGRANMLVSERVDTVDYELRAMWTRAADKTINIVWVYKKVRLSGQVLHNVCQGNVVADVAPGDVPAGFEEDVRRYCAVLPDLHGGLDIIVDKSGRYYFTENNVLTGYLDEEVERPYLEKWLDAVAAVHAGRA